MHLFCVFKEMFDVNSVCVDDVSSVCVCVYMMSVVCV